MRYKASIFLLTHFLFTLILLPRAGCAMAGAQEAGQPGNPIVPAITFDLYWESATPQNFTVTVQAAGAAAYRSRNPTRREEDAEQAPDPDYEVAFTMSKGTRERLFQLAQAAHYFNGEFDFKRPVANTGKKTLTYADPARHFQTTYNWSENQAITQITTIFRGISNTAEHGRKLQFLHRFDRLGLDAELKSMEDMAQNHELAELQIIASTLQEIAGDSAVLNLARQRARHLLTILNAS